MACNVRIPRRLYKYRDSSSRTVDMLVSDHVYYADPSEFNDPFDAQPSLDIDIDEIQLEKLLRKFVEQRTKEEMNDAALVINYTGPKTIEHIRRRSHRQARQFIREVERSSKVGYWEFEVEKRFRIERHVKEELLRRYTKGIVSLAARATCPLMWSHYGDQHRGICIGYSVPANAASDIHKVKYGGSRLVKASDIVAMLNGNNVACTRIDETILLRKAGSWRYEREWRLIGPLGLRRSPLELEEVIFGLRCRESTMYAVMKALENRVRPVKFYEIGEVEGTFNVKKRLLHKEYDDLFKYFPHRALSWTTNSEDESPSS